MYGVVTQDLPASEAKTNTIKKLINSAVPDNSELISVTFCQGPNGIQRMVIVFIRVTN